MTTKLEHLFVYGTLRDDNARHKPSFLDREGSFVCNSFTADDLVLMETTGFPVAFKVWKGNKELPVYGELWEIPPELLKATDRIEAEGFMYKKERMKIISVDEQETFEAWMYLGLPRFWYNHNELLLAPIANDQYYNWVRHPMKKVG